MPVMPAVFVIQLVVCSHNDAYSYIHIYAHLEMWEINLPQSGVNVNLDLVSLLAPSVESLG